MDNGVIGRELADAADARSACRIVIDAIARRDALLPSAYLERGGRLRCQAVHGYWQVRDGIPPGTGVIGEVFRTGAEILMTGSGRLSEHYLPAADAVVAEIAFPLRCGERVIGVLNVESPHPLSDEDVAFVRHCAELLQTRICSLGGPPTESAPQRLVRHAAGIASLHDVDAIEAAMLEAAVDVLLLDSAVLLRLGGPGLVRPGPAIGPLADVLRAATPQTLEAVADYVTDGTSAYTVTDAGGDATAGVRALREAGARALAAVLVDPERVLLVAASEEHPPATDDIELLELLALQAGVSLRTAVSVSALRVQAASDPLTGLGHHRSFHQALNGLRALSGAAVVVADLDGFKAYNDAYGHPAGDRLLREAASLLVSALRREDALYRIGGDEFAALLRVDGPAEALEVGRRLHDAVGSAGLGVSISVGVAMVQSWEEESAALARADQALYAVKASGRDGVRLAEPDQVTPPDHAR